MSNQEDEYYKNNSVENIFWKMKEGDLSCKKISKKLETCGKANSPLSVETCENLSTKLSTCIFSHLSSKLKKCVSYIDITLPTTRKEEMDKIEECTSDPNFQKILQDWQEKIDDPIMKDPLSFFPHENLVHLDHNLSIDDDDGYLTIKEKIKECTSNKFCEKEQKEALECWKNQEESGNTETCFKQDSKFFYCSLSILCGKQIKNCIEKNSHLGKSAYAFCLQGNINPIERCALKYTQYYEEE